MPVPEGPIYDVVASVEYGIGTRVAQFNIKAEGIPAPSQQAAIAEFSAALIDLAYTLSKKGSGAITIKRWEADS